MLSINTLYTGVAKKEVKNHWQLLRTTWLNKPSKTHLPYRSSAFVSKSGIPLKNKRIDIRNKGLRTEVHRTLSDFATSALIAKAPHQTRISPK